MVSRMIWFAQSLTQTDCLDHGIQTGNVQSWKYCNSHSINTTELLAKCWTNVFTSTWFSWFAYKAVLLVKTAILVSTRMTEPQELNFIYFMHDSVVMLYIKSNLIRYAQFRKVITITVEQNHLVQTATWHWNVSCQTLKILIKMDKLV